MVRVFLCVGRWILSQTGELTNLVVVAFLVACFVSEPRVLNLGEWLTRRLETRIPGPDLERLKKIDGIIVLGGSVRRVRAALEIVESYPSVPVILSGPGKQEIRLAQNSLNNAAERLIIDQMPTSTYQNALHTLDLVSPKQGSCWILITSAIHMPRAFGVFQALSFPVIPWPIHAVYGTPKTPRAYFGPVWHEVIGLIAYRMLGRINDLFPRLKRVRGHELASDADSRAAC